MREQEFLQKVVTRDNRLDVHSLEFEKHPEGSSVWLEREDLLLEFTRLVGAARDGGATIAECLSTANAIDFADDLINPPELGILEKAVTDVPKGKAILVPASAETVDAARDRSLAVA